MLLLYSYVANMHACMCIANSIMYVVISYSYIAGCVGYLCCYTYKFKAMKSRMSANNKDIL